MQVVKLNNPIMVNGNEVKEVQLDFEAIRGKDLIAAEKEVRKMGDTTPAVGFSGFSSSKTDWRICRGYFGYAFD